MKRFDYVFAENGLVAYKGRESIGQEVNKQCHLTDWYLLHHFNLDLALACVQAF